MGIFSSHIMQKAFIIGVLIAAIIPCIGMTVVLKRLSMIGDALAHSSLAGVAAGLLFNITPLLGAAAACVIAALSIEAVRKKLPRYSEISIAILMSAGIGLAGVLSGFIKNSFNFNYYLFGSIVSISDGEMLLTAAVSAVVIAAFFLLYKELFYTAFDERAARLSGVPVKTVNFIFTLLTAVTVSVSAKIVGSLIVSSLMVIPVACSMQFGKSYKNTVLLAVIFSLAFMVSGLCISYYGELKPGGTIVLIGVLCFFIIMLSKTVYSKIRKIRKKV